MTEPIRLRVNERPRGDYRSDARAAETLSETAYILYAARQAARLFWSIVCKRFPELR